MSIQSRMDMDALLARIATLEARVSALEAERATDRLIAPSPFRDGPYWQIPPVTCGGPAGNASVGAPVYEHYVDPTMRETRNGN